MAVFTDAYRLRVLLLAWHAEEGHHKHRYAGGSDDDLLCCVCDLDSPCATALEEAEDWRTWIVQQTSARSAGVSGAIGPFPPAPARTMGQRLLVALRRAAGRARILLWR